MTTSVKKILFNILGVCWVLFILLQTKAFAGTTYDYCGALGEPCCCRVTIGAGQEVIPCVEGLPSSSEFCDSTEGVEQYPVFCDESSPTSPTYLHCAACTAEAGALCCPGNLCAAPNTCNEDTGRCEGQCGHFGEPCCVQYSGGFPVQTCYDSLVCSDDEICGTVSPCDEVGEDCCQDTSGGYPVGYCTAASGLVCGDDNLCHDSQCGNEVDDPCCWDAATGDGYCLGELSCSPILNVCRMPCDEDGDSCCQSDSGSYYCSGDYWCDPNELRCIYAPDLEEDEPPPSVSCGLLGYACCDIAHDLPTPDTDLNGCRDPLVDVSWVAESSSGCTCWLEGACGADFQYCCTSSATPCDSPLSGCLGGVCVPGYDYLNNFTSYGGYILPDVTALLAPIFKILFYAGIAVGILAIILSGYLLMSSEGDPNKVKEAKEQFSASIFGIMFILLSLFLLRVIINNILGADLGF